MTVSSPAPQIYHITHVENLASIISCGELLSDAECLRQGLLHTKVGITEIKRRRLYELDVDCHSGTKVGDYVPFYFCPRSIMLYLLHMSNHPDLVYKGGQQSIIHLQADLLDAVSWANNKGIHWAFSDRNAGTRYTAFYKDLNSLKQLDWGAVNTTDFRDPIV